MDTTALINTILSREDDVATEAVKVLELEMEAIPPECVRRVNVDIPNASSTVLAAIPKIVGIKSAIVAAAPNFDIRKIDKLEPCALALRGSHLVYLALIETPDELRVLCDQAIVARDLFRTDAAPLCKRGLIEASALKDCRGLMGYRNIATELGLVVTVFKGAWSVIQGKTAVTLDELERARRISQAMARYVGYKEQASLTVAEASDKRARAFTLLHNCYDEVRRVVIYTRWAEGDAETIAPSIYAGRNRGDDTSEEEGTTETGAQAAHNQTTPSTETGTSNGTSTGTGSSTDEPFMQ